jgi:hypothetical protein
MSVLTDEITAYVHKYWLDGPGDITNLKRKNREIAKEFPVYLYCSGHMPY